MGKAEPYPISHEFWRFTQITGRQSVGHHIWVRLVIKRPESRVHRFTPALPPSRQILPLGDALVDSRSSTYGRTIEPGNRLPGGIQVHEGKEPGKSLTCKLQAACQIGMIAPMGSRYLLGLLSLVLENLRGSKALGFSHLWTLRNRCIMIHPQN